jgi:hypothetical protein
MAVTHHGTEAITAATAASTFRTRSFIVSLAAHAIRRQVQKPTTKIAEAQVMAVLARVPRRWTYRT